MKTMIITGGSSGIGKATAELFSVNGYKVYEFSRHGESTDAITHIDCDVTDAAMCREAVKTVVAECDTLDLLVSNAGMGISGAIEFTDEKDVRRQFDVNFFGSLNITQAVLPYMRQQKSGKIIYVSSMMAVYGLPFQAFYSASKAALSSMAMALENEVRPFGIKVCTLIPGDVKTGFTDARKKEVTGADIYTHMNKAVETMEHDEQNGITPERMAKAILSMAKAGNPSPVKTVGWMYHLFLFLGRLVPYSLKHRIIGMMY